MPAQRGEEACLCSLQGRGGKSIAIQAAAVLCQHSGERRHQLVNAILYQFVLKETLLVLEVRLLGIHHLRLARRALNPPRGLPIPFAYLMLNAGTDFRREKLPECCGRLLDRRERASSAARPVAHAQGAAVAAASCLKADDLTIGIDASADYQLDAATARSQSEAKEPVALMAALSAYGGELLPGFYDEWVVLERSTFRRCSNAMERLLNLLQGAGHWMRVRGGREVDRTGQRPEPRTALMLAHARTATCPRWPPATSAA
jgi:hypothetical protein